jgi:hypothetical protein
MKTSANFFACCFFPEAYGLKKREARREKPFLSEEIFNHNMNYYT